MAFKRSAVRSRLSPPKVVKSTRFHDFFFIFCTKSCCGHVQDAFKPAFYTELQLKSLEKILIGVQYEIYISAVTARGVKDKTIATYKQHFHAISKRLDVSLPINRLNSTILDNMILQMGKEGLSDSSINSYTRTLKCFLSWCNEEGYTKAGRTVREASAWGWPSQRK